MRLYCFYKITDQIMAVLGCYAFGMKLDAVDGLGFMSQSHDQSVFGLGCDGEAIGKAFPFDDQGMVTGGWERGWQSFKDTLPVMMDGGNFAVHGFRCTDDLPAKGLPYRLKPQANTEEGNIMIGARLDKGEADTGMVRVAGAGRY